MSSKTLAMMSEHDVKWIDLRFTDTRGKEQHLSVPASVVDEEFFVEGKAFDGSSVAGWKGIHQSDMTLMPEDDTAVLNPFTEETTLNLRCDVQEPDTGQAYERDPRSCAKRAETYLNASGVGDAAYMGPEPEFFVFDDVRWESGIGGAFYKIHSEEAAWASGMELEDGNRGHRPAIKGGYFPVPPVDSAQDLRGAMCEAMENMGLKIEVHHHEVGTACQNEIGTRFQRLTRKADEVQMLKFCVQNTADMYGQTATFMPKPLVGDNGNGMHCHISLFQGDENVFAGDGYAGLSDTALFFVGGVIRHARAVNAFTNASTNSYKRLVPGFEAPVLLAYSARNRSASIRVPYVASPKARRVEVRFPDSAGNPYLAFAALLMAGLDGVQNRLHPGEPAHKDLYDLPPEEAAGIPTVASSLEQALDALDADRGFLTAGGVFSDDLIDGYIELKRGEVELLNMSTHPVEFQMYYSL